MYLSELDMTALDRETITKVIFEDLDDDGQSGDLILIFGSITAPRVRVPKAVELYKANRARKMIMSGGLSTVPEAHAMKETAVNHGVQEADIIVEDKSTNTRENIMYSRAIMDEKFGLENIRRILLVTNYFHLKRCYLSMRTFMPDWMDYSLCGVLDTNTRPDNWWSNEKGQIRVQNEMEKLIRYTKSKEIVDCLV